MKKEISDQDDWWRFLKMCLRLKDEKELSELFDLFLTLEEKEDLKTRFLIIQELLKEKIPQREIGSSLGVSISKITRGSNALKIISPMLREFLEGHFE